MQISRTVAALTCAAGLTVSGLAVAAPANAQQQRGLVNVNVSEIDVETGDILSNNEVNVGIGVAAGIAANVCGVAVGVLARDLAAGEDFECRSQAGDQAVEIDQDS